MDSQDISEISSISENLNTNNETILNQIFKKSKENNSKFIPILKKDGELIIKKIFTEYPDIADYKSLSDYISKKLDLVNQIETIIGNSYEILYIIFDYLEVHNISPFIYFIDLYINYITKYENISSDENKKEIIEKIKNIFSWFISCGLLKKKIIDYIYQKIALFQLEKKLTLNIFSDIIPLLEIIYGKYYNDSIVNNFIAKKYFYLYDKETSLIRTNISDNNKIAIKNGFCMVLWFYLNNYENSPKCSLCQIKTDNNQIFNIILSDNYDIEIQYNESLIMKEKENKFYCLKQKVWTQLKIEFNSSAISLYLYQNNVQKGESGNLFEKKLYIISKDNQAKQNNENENINIIENYNCENINIMELSFFNNYLGIIGSILFFNKLSNNDKDMAPIDSLYGLENKKINEFIKDKNILPSLYFIFAPSLYLYDQNKLIDFSNNIIGELPPKPYQIGKDKFNLNSIFIFHNYINNIFYLGGCNNFLPLFEIFYKFSLEEHDINYLKELFNNIFKLLEVIFMNRKKNAILPIKKETTFFESLQLFMEKIDSKYYSDNENLLKTLINIANYYNQLKINKIIEFKENSGFFNNILYNPILIMKFNLSLQEKLLKEIENYSILIPSSNINKLLLLLSQRYTNDELEKNGYTESLFNYILKIFENNNVDDSQRESLFLLYKNKNNNYSNNIYLSDNIFIHIMKTFILYLDLGINKYNESGVKRRKNTVNYLLNSNNYFIECLLNYLSETNIHVKKEIINFLRILTQTYGDILEQYFLKQSKNKKIKNKINKAEFYDFIKENIAPNYSNEYLMENENDKNIKNDDEDDSIFSLKNDDEKNNTKEQNLIPKFDRKRSKSIENNKKIKKDEKIKKFKSIFESNKSNKDKRKNSYSKKIKNEYSKNKDKDKKDKNKIDKNVNKIIVIKKKSTFKDLTDEEKIVIQNTKFEISLVLYNWLTSLIRENENINTNDKSKDINKNEESIQHVIDYIVKFISYSKEVEVIYRTLLLILDQKDRNKIGHKDEYTTTYYKLLNYLSKNSLFIQILIELLVNSYLYKNLEKDKVNDIFVIISKSNQNLEKMKEKFINLIYDHSKELLMDIYFDTRNLNKYDIIIQMFCIILKLTKGLEDNIDEYKRNLLLKFLKELFLGICQEYNKKNNFPIADYIRLFSLFVEYSFLIKSPDNYINNIYKKIKNDCTHCFPDFLIFGILYELNVSEWSGYDIYKIISYNIKQIFAIDKIFKDLEFIYKKDNNKNNINFDKKKDIYIYDIDIINSLINEIINNKNKKEYKLKTNALIYSYQNWGYDNNFPLINMLSLFNSVNLYLFYSDTNEKKKVNLISLLNDIQNYIIFLLLSSLIIEENDNFIQSKTYDQIQKLFYKNIYFNIKNIINHLNDKENLSKYLEVLHNIILFLSVIYNIEQKLNKKKKESNFFKNLFTSKIDISKTAPIFIIQFFMKNSEKLFNDDNFQFFINNKKENKEKAFALINDNINKDIIDNPSFDLYRISIFEKIVRKRDTDLKLKLRLLITKEKEFNVAVNNYKKIFLKVKSIKNNFYYDEIKNNQKELFKIKKYRKIKKDLYSFNNSYSNLEVFYNLKLNKNKNKYLLKYKISNFLSKDMTRKIIKPIIDINYYMPSFRKYNYESNEIYHHLNNQVYSVDLNIFDNGGIPPLSPDNNKEFYKNQYYMEDDICFIKTMNHIKGIIFHLNNLESEYFYFCMTKLPSEKELIKSYPDYDSINKSCFSSIFRLNLNKKDIDIYLKIKFTDIYFIFNRKYCFKDNSIEIFTSNHRSYYFKFKNNEKRNKFMEHLITRLNKDSSIFKKLYKPIYSIDENNKKIILGYYKDIDNNSEYSNITNIKDLWKNSKISTLEYLMWINIYGNRSYRDVSQFPVLPWIIDEYKTKTFQEIIDKDGIRNFEIPMGMMCLDEKGKERAEGYVSTYKFMSLELKEAHIVDFKINENEEEEENEVNFDNNYQRPKSFTVIDNSNNIKNKIDQRKSMDPNINNIIVNKKTKNLPKIPNYNYNIDKLYTNLNVPYDQIPYCFGSHFSNGMYVSHFLGRLFPYCLTMIEIQGTGFDCSERLFLCIDKTFLSSSNEKCDVRELIPEFYTIPEMFININKLNFGEVSLNNFTESIDYLNEIIENNKGENKIKVENVIMPNWCKYNPYLFIQLKRELLENKNRIDLNPWIDLIFGFCQRGAKAQSIGNLFLPYTYDGTLNIRIKEQQILDNREDYEYLLRLFELGVNPTKVFEKKIYDKKKNIRQISNIREVEKPIPYIGGFEEKINYITNIGNIFNNLFVYYKKHKIKKYIFDDKLDINGNYIIKEISNYKDLSDIFSQNNISKLIIKYLYKSNIFLITGFYNGNLYIIESNPKLNNLNSNIISKVSQEDQALLQNYGKGIITSLEISKDEKYIIYGNNKGTLVVIEFDYNIYLENNENKKYLKILNIISSHSGFNINSIFVNSDLNLYADCSNDNYIHIYTLPQCEKINSIYIENTTFKIDYIFLSSQPLASIILYSNKLFKFKCYSINGHDLNVDQNDQNIYNELKIKNCSEPMISPIIFTDSAFIDYLLYVFGYQFILLRKTPLMDIVFKIKFEGNEFISMINISLYKECIYIVDNNNKKVHVVKYKINKQVSPNTSLDNK